MQNINKTTKKEWIIWAACIIVPLLLFLIPTSEQFTAQIRLFLVLSFMAILMFAFEIVPQAVPAIVLPIAYVLFGLAPSSVVFSAWAGYIPWMMLGGLVLASVLQSTGLLTRIAYWCIIKTGGSYMGILIGLAFTGIIGNLLAPGKVVIPMAALTYGICMALNLGKSKASAGIMLGGAVSALLPQQFIYNPTNIALTVGIGEPVTGKIDVSWWDYFYLNLPALFFVFVVVIAIAIMCKPKDVFSEKEYFVKEYQKLGKVSMAEIKTMLVCCGLFAFLLTSKWHGLEVGWGFALFPCLFFLPGIKVGKPEDLTSINFSFVLFITACLAIGNTASELGVGQLIADWAIPFIEGKSLFFTFGLTWCIIVLSNFVLTPLAIMACLSLPMAQIALNLGIDPLAIYFLMTNAYDPVLFPYEYALYLIFFSFGLIRMKDFVSIMGVKMVLNFLFCMLVMVPFWMVVGLI